MTVLYLSELSSVTEREVGLKAKNLYRVYEAGIRVPEGVVVTVEHYNDWVMKEGLRHEIFRSAVSLKGNGNIAEVAERVERASRRARLIELPDDLVEEIISKLEDISAKFVVVRPSPYAMGLKDGDLEGRMRVWFDRATKEGIKRALINLWTDVFSLRFLSRLLDLGIPPEDVSLATIVQKVIHPMSSGVAICCPSRRAGEILIESTWGLMSQDSPKDRFKVQSDEMKVVESELKEKRYKIIPTAQGIRREEVPQALWVSSSLDEAKTLEIARASITLSHVFGTPTKVEWILQDGTSELYVIQAHKEPERPPIRTIERRVIEFLSQPTSRVEKDEEVRKESKGVEGQRKRREKQTPISIIVTGTRLFLRSKSPKNVEDFDGVLTTLSRSAEVQGKEVIALLPKGLIPEREIEWSTRISYAVVVETDEEIRRIGERLRGLGAREIWAVMRNPGSAITLSWSPIILDIPSLIRPFRSDVSKVIFVEKLLNLMRGKKFIISLIYGPLTETFIERGIAAGAYGIAVEGKANYYRQVIYRSELRKVLGIL